MTPKRIILRPTQKLGFEDKFQIMTARNERMHNDAFFSRPNTRHSKYTYNAHNESLIVHKKYKGSLLTMENKDKKILYRAQIADFVKHTAYQGLDSIKTIMGQEECVTKGYSQCFYKCELCYRSFIIEDSYTHHKRFGCTMRYAKYPNGKRAKQWRLKL